MTSGTRWWLERKRTPADAETMWESWLAPHRQHLILALRCLPPVASLYEIGCGSGPNLRLLKAMYPEMRLGGSEPCQGLATWASEHIGCHIDQAFLPDGAPTGYDVMLSCYALAYVDEDAVRETLRRTETLHAILMEPNAGLVSGGAGVPEVQHDYLTALEETGWRLQFRWPIMPPVQGLNACIVASR
jgi:hypothetical protein